MLFRFDLGSKITVLVQEIMEVDTFYNFLLNILLVC